MSSVSIFEVSSDILQVLSWGIALAHGLEYLHDNGVTFAGQIDAGHIGLAAGHPVWANFTNCVHHPEGYVIDRKPDTVALARLVFQWLTQKKQFERDPNLPPAFNRAFEPFYSGAFVEDSNELADLFERALQDTASPEKIDFRLGRRTHVGKSVKRTITVAGGSLDSLARIGVYRDGMWYLDMNGDGAWSAGDAAYGFGAPGWTAVLGDWDGSGSTRIGVYRDGVWYLDRNGDGTWSAGDADHSFGAPGWTAKLGAWG